MKWQANWEGPMQSYMQRFVGLLGDTRTRWTFQESIKGIMAACTLISPRIVTTHLDRIYIRLGINSRTALVLYAIEAGLLPPKDGTT